MPIALTCPKCQAQQTVPDGPAGRTVECPTCRTTFPIDASAPPEQTPARRRVLPWVVGLVLLGGVGLAAYQLFPRSTPTDFTDPDGLFSARFPNPPEAEAVSQAQPLRLVWGERLYRAKARGAEYSVTVLDGVNSGDQPYGPGTRDTHVNGAVAVKVTNANGRQLAERPATHEGHPAREVVFVDRENGRLTALRVLAGERHVLLLAVTGSGDKDDPNAFLDRAGEFFAGVHVGAGFGAPVVDVPPTVPAAELVAAYKADARAADARYKDRWLRVTGPVREVAEDGTEFLLGPGGDAVLVRRAPRARQSVPVREPGATVEATGKCRGLEAVGGAGARVLLEDAIVSRPASK